MANALQAFNDSTLGVVLGTALHTLGAIGLLGGLVGYLAWRRHLRHGHHHASLLAGATFLAYLSILVNLLGGFMRTFESGHPHLTAFADSAWVRAIAIKHLFLFVGMGAAVVLFERVAPRQLKAMRQGTLAQAPTTGHAVGVTLVALGIVVAALLGAVSSVLPVAAADDGMEDDGHGGHNETVRYENATGQLTGFLPMQPATARATFEVPAGTRSLNATLVWDPGQFCVRLSLLPPGQSDAPTGACAPPPDPGVRTVDVANPAPGTWTYVLDAASPVQVAWTLSIAMPAEGSGGSLFATVTIPPQGGYEINTQMPLRGTVEWDWTSSATVHFNLHSHFDGAVQDYVDEDTAASRSAYTNGRAGGYSLFWTNGGNLPVTLTYEVWGDFTLDSISS